MTPDDVIVLSKAEAEELYRFTVNSYIDPNTYPALRKLLDRMGSRSLKVSA